MIKSCVHISEVSEGPGLVLVIAKAPGGVKLLTSTLTAQGYETYTTTDDSSAFESASDRGPDLILLSCRGRERDGLITLKRLKADKKTCDLPVIFILSDAESDLKDAVFQSGATDIVTEPIHKKELLVRVKTHLDLRKLGNSLEEILAWDPGGSSSKPDQLQEKLAKLEKDYEELQQSGKKYRRLFEAITLGVIFQNSQGKIVSANPAAENILGIPADKMKKRQLIPLVGRVIKEDGSDFRKEDDPSMAALEKGAPVNNVIMGISKSGNEDYRWININSAPLYQWDRKEPVIVYTTFEDITDSRIAQEQFKNSLKEKEVLLQEVHHRVRNNMQVISSILKLQASTIKDRQASEALQESENRVQAMAAVHDTLYKSETFAFIDFYKYVSALSEYLMHIYMLHNRNILLKLEIDDIQIGLDQASPVGLILNELLTNSFKYAFPNNRPGKISIKARLLNDCQIELVVCDDGVGIPNNISWIKPKSLGLKIVRRLVEGQLEGIIDLSRQQGTEFTITFKLWNGKSP